MLVGLSPEPYTLRQLCKMARRKRQEEWDHTAALMALLANCHRNERRRPQPYTPDDFHPLKDRHTKHSTGRRRLHPQIRQLLVEAMTGKRLPRLPGRWERFETDLRKEPRDGEETEPSEGIEG